MKKTMCLLIAMMLAVTALTGMAVAEEREIIEITVTGSRNAYCDNWEDTEFAKSVLERFGIKLIDQSFSSEEWTVQYGLLFASGELPDLFVNTGWNMNTVSDYGSQGFLLSLNDLIETSGVYCKAVFDANPDMQRIVTSPDGNIYCLVNGSAIPANMANRNWINEKWIENVGMTYPETLEDLYAVLCAFRDQDANGNGDPSDEIPASGTILHEIVLNALGIPTKSSSGAGFYVNAEDEVTMIATDALYKVFLTYMHQYYEEGLLDSATFVQSGSEFNAKIGEGRVGAYTLAAPWLYESEETAWDYRYFGGLTSEYNSNKIVGASSGVDSWAAVAISASCAHPERVFEMLDWLYSDEGSTVGFIGEENVGWKWVNEAEGDWARVLPEGWTDSDEAYRGGTLTILGLNLYRSEEWKLFKPTGNNVWLYDQYTDYAVPYFTSAFPSVVLTEEELDSISGIATDIESYVTDATTRFIVGEEDIESGWDTFQNTLRSMGVEDYTAVYAEAYARFMGK